MLFLPNELFFFFVKSYIGISILHELLRKDKSLPYHRIVRACLWDGNVFSHVCMFTTCGWDGNVFSHLYVWFCKHDTLEQTGVYI